MHSDSLPAPDFSGLGIIKGCDDASHAGDLSDLLKCDSVEFGTVPSQCHFHSNYLSFILYKLLLFQ